jgi:hypothetical protein
MAKTSQEILTDLVADFVAHPSLPRLLSNREAAERAREGFLADYPFRDNPGGVRNIIRIGADAQDFVRRLARDPLLWLGAIDLHGNQPISAAGANVEVFRALVERVADPGIKPWKKINGPDWGRIPGFGGEFRQIAKKMVNIYYPELTLPVFNTEHLEHFGQYLRVDKNSISIKAYGWAYGSLPGPGEIWHVLSEGLTRERDQNKILQNEDNIYFMYCLYRTRACPPGFRPREP